MPFWVRYRLFYYGQYGILRCGRRGADADIWPKRVGKAVTASSIVEAREKLQTCFEALSNREARMAYLIAAGKKAVGLPERLKTEENLVAGCLAKTWVSIEKTDEIYNIGMDSESVIMRGILNILVELYDGRNITEIRQVTPKILEQTRVLESLSASRRNGLTAVCRIIETLES